jgi:hypothetical protein
VREADLADELQLRWLGHVEGTRDLWRSLVSVRYK